MAIMIPQKPREISPNSLEDIMFGALEKLPDSYYVFHSFKIVSAGDGILHESETDFVIFNAQKGLMCVEAKAGKVYYKDGEWFYGSGIRMSHDGPFNQASRNKWKLRDYINTTRLSGLLSKCKLLHAVWFPSVSELDIRGQTMPPEADRKLVMTSSALQDPETEIVRIFDIKLSNGIETSLSDLEARQLVDMVLCPSFNVFPTASLDLDIKRIAFHLLLNEQICLLNYLEEQKTAVINGAAGTGKTMIAIEKAKRHAANGEKVLFLCYNSKLRQYLSETHTSENIDFYTVDGLACKLCNSAVPDYERLKEYLEDRFFAGVFPYKHIIIDEGQDFGQSKLEETDIIRTFKDIVTDDTIDGSFYIFYDKYQLVQGSVLPEYIAEADCKLTLYKNCRNTENIAVTSLRPITERNPVLAAGCVTGSTPKFYFRDPDTEMDLAVASIISDLNADGVKDIVILTPLTEETSKLAPFCTDGMFRKKTRFTTCRKFKGLEADAVILIDIDANTFAGDNAKVFYVGASRARYKLCLLSDMDDADCREALSKFTNKHNPRKPKRELASALNSVSSILHI